MAEEDKKEEEIGSFYMGRRSSQSSARRVLPPGVLTILALAVLGGIIWYAYPRGAERYTNLDVPVVKAETAPIKEKPENPGGMEVSHQDSTVFDPLQKNGNAEIEKLTPGPEQPLDKAEAISPIAASPTVPPELNLHMEKVANGTEVIIPEAPEAKPPVTAVTPAPKPAPEKKVVAAAPEAKKTVEAKPAGKSEAESKPKKEAVAEKKKDEKTAAAGDYEVQLGSYREQADGKKDWTRLQKKYAAQLGSLKMRLVKADIPGKGVYYRMRAGVVSKDKAQSICDALKSAHGVGCILAKR